MMMVVVVIDISEEVNNGEGSIILARKFGHIDFSGDSGGLSGLGVLVE